MIKLAVYGDLKWSHIMKNLLENQYSELLSQNDETILAPYFVIDNPKADDQISVASFAEKYHNKELDAIVIPKEYYIPYNALIFQLVKYGININDIYNGMRLSDKLNYTASMVSGLITPMLSDSYLSYLEYHVADHCNLNCKYCTHYSPLVNEPVFTDFPSFCRDLEQFKIHINDVGVIRILGGEPLLNKELPDFIKYTRKLFPASIITVVTNGMLLDRIDEQLIKAMQENIAFFHISYYPPLEGRIDSVKKMLVENNIAFTITPKIDKFNKTQCLEHNNNEDFFYDCFQATCTCLHQGKVAPCYAPFTSKYFNKAYDQKLPTDEGIDIYAEALTTEELKLQLLYPLKRCGYCINGQACDWEIIGTNSKLEDWV